MATWRPGVKGFDPIANNQLDADEIAQGRERPDATG